MTRKPSATGKLICKNAKGGPIGRWAPPFNVLWPYFISHDRGRGRFRAAYPGHHHGLVPAETRLDPARAVRPRGRAPAVLLRARGQAVPSEVSRAAPHRARSAANRMPGPALAEPPRGHEPEGRPRGRAPVAHLPGRARGVYLHGRGLEELRRAASRVASLLGAYRRVSAADLPTFHVPEEHPHAPAQAAHPLYPAQAAVSADHVPAVWLLGNCPWLEIRLAVKGLQAAALRLASGSAAWPRACPLFVAHRSCATCRCDSPACYCVQAACAVHCDQT